MFPADLVTFTKVILSGKLHFLCSVRWLENPPVTKRALEILPRIKAYLEIVKKKLFTNPKSKTFEFIVESCNNALLTPKLSFL